MVVRVKFSLEISTAVGRFHLDEVFLLLSFCVHDFRCSHGYVVPILSPRLASLVISKMKMSTHFL